LTTRSKGKVERLHLTIGDDGWLCTAYPQDELNREQSEPVI
jgi:hypothetical protein